MINETSAGIVIYRQLKTKRPDRSAANATARPQHIYLLLHYPSGHFDFPKGHIEKNELEREAAFRELKEETGIKKIVWIPGFREKIRYQYLRDTKYSSKEVIFFLARTTQKKITISFEHQGSLWLPYEEALQKITYQQAKNVLEKAEKFLFKKKFRTRS